MSHIAAAPKVVDTSNIDLEHALLGSLIWEPYRVNDVMDIIKPEYFSDPFHRKIYEAMEALHRSGQTFDALLISSHIDDDEFVRANGGKIKYIGNLADGLPRTVVNIKDYAITLRRLYTNRAIEAARNDKTLTQTQYAQIAQEILHEANEFELARQSFYTAKQSYDLTISQIEATHKHGGFMGLKTGWNSLDEMLCGLDGGGLYVVAGRPAMGKTAFALTTAINVALQGHPVLFFSLEMAYHQLINRVIARFAQVGMKEQRSGMPYGGFEKLLAAKADIAALPLDIEDISGQTAAQIAARARQDMLRKRYKLIVIDHLAIVKDPPYINSKVQALAQSTAELKGLAKSLNVPVLLLHQLNRGVEGRDDKRPSLADLRDGGSVEQDADAVMMLYRPEYYMKNEPARKPNEKPEAFHMRVNQWADDLEKLRGKAEVLIEKNRQGETGKITMNFNGLWQMFTEETNEVV